MFKVSKGNSKLGNIYNINLPAIVTCRHDAPCKKKCYANKGTFKFKNVIACYENNLDSFIISPEKTELDILQQLPYMGVVRLHSSGDFVNMDYLKMIVRICNKLPNVKFMAFTKKYELINTYVEEYDELPSNLKIIFSLWEGLKCPNENNFPTSIVRFKKGINDNIQQAAFECMGKCDKCFKCWDLQKGEQVVFNEH